MAVFQRLRDRFLTETSRLFDSFYDSLREDRFFLLCYLVGSYLVIQIIVDDLNGLPTGSVFVLIFGLILLVLATFKRLVDLEAEKQPEYL